MTRKATVIDTLVSADAKWALWELAARDSREQGKEVSPSDLLRQALADYFKRREVEVDVEFDPNDTYDPREALREALLDVKVGRVHPIETLWEDVEDDD
jgi:hypothetical protein